MKWEFRVGFRTVSYSVVDDNDHKLVVDTLEETQYGVVETYYNDDGEITFTSAEFQSPYGETLEGLKVNFDMMQKAFELPVLDLDSIVYVEIGK
jgi:hypothetical protein